ncbi:MAG: hypothetical protein V3V03_06800 [Hyphomonadaceae bacterium]
MSRSVVIRRCASVEGALVVQALLQDAGFGASLENWHMAALDWAMIPALNGIAIWIPESELIPAGQYMIDAVDTAAARLEEATGPLDDGVLKRSRFKPLTMLFFYLGGVEFLVPPLYWLLISLPQEWFPFERSYPTINPVFAQGHYSSPGVDLSHAFSALVFLAIILALTFNEVLDIQQGRLDRQARNVNSEPPT